jgi:hypothetical protein
MISRVLMILLLLATASAGAAQTDGPYLLRGAQGWEVVSVEPSAKGPVPHRERLAANSLVTVPSVNAVPAFPVKVRGPAPVAPDDIKVPDDTPQFVVADTHGEYEILVAQLQKHGVIDGRLRWSFGRGRLVVLGDVFDRGPNHLEILWLLYKLEAEAAKAGGGAHLVLGNHEAMVMTGDLRYLNPKYVETASVLGVRSYSELFAANTLLGQWLRTRPALLKLNGNLGLHAGVSRALLDSGLSISEINTTIRSLLTGDTLTNTDKGRAELLMGQLGPLWYRGYFADQANFPIATLEDVDRILGTYGVKRILVGHTRVPAITSLYGGRVIAVHVYPERDAAGTVHFESLLIRGDALSRASPSGLVPLAP